MSARDDHGSRRYTVSREAYAKKFEGLELDRECLNNLIMNYLEIEGFKEAAETFRKESGTGSGSLEAIQDRGEVSECLATGRVGEAMAKISETFPQVLEDEDIAFRLKHQQLLEYVQSGDVEKTLNYARDAMASSALSPANLERMEQALCLIAFGDPAQCKYASLLGPAQRQQTSSVVNSAILRSTGRDPTPLLLQLLRLIYWMEHTLRHHVQFPDAAEIVRPPFGLATGAHEDGNDEDLEI